MNPAASTSLVMVVVVVVVMVMVMVRAEHTQFGTRQPCALAGPLRANGSPHNLRFNARD